MAEVCLNLLSIYVYIHVCLFNDCSDMSKPINVLTGIDYWLDNLMCNVPELAMCYHDKGIVQVSFYCCTLPLSYQMTYFRNLN